MFQRDTSPAPPSPHFHSCTPESKTLKAACGFPDSSTGPHSPLSRSVCRDGNTPACEAASLCPSWLLLPLVPLWSIPAYSPASPVLQRLPHPGLMLSAVYLCSLLKSPSTLFLATHGFVSGVQAHIPFAFSACQMPPGLNVLPQLSHEC